MSEKTTVTVWALSPEEMPQSKDPKTARSMAIGYSLIGKAMSNPGKHVLITDHEGGENEILFQRIKKHIMKNNLRGFTFLQTGDKLSYIILFDLNKFNRTELKGKVPCQEQPI